MDQKPHMRTRVDGNGRRFYDADTKDHRSYESSASADKCWRVSSSSSTARFTEGTIQRNADYLKEPQNKFVVAPRQHDNSRKKLDLQSLLKLTNDEIEPSEIIRCLSKNLATELEMNLGNPEYLELILVAMGTFCRKNGPSQFTEGFAAIVNILANQKVFAQIITILMNIPTSRAQNLPTKEERLKRLTTAIYHLVTEILVMMPTFGCNWLGQNFFTDILFMKAMPSIKSLGVADAFDVLEDGVLLLQTAWNQHVVCQNKKDLTHSRKQEEQEAQEFDLEDPPDDFRTLKIMPSPEDVCLDLVPFLRPNIVKGIYPDVETYLDIQFRLLREDFFQPLRLGLLAYKNRRDGKSSRGSDNVRFYYQVNILEYDMSHDAYTIQFSISNSRKIVWAKSKRFLHGSLLCLSSDNFSSFLIFTVVEKNIDLLEEGKIKAKFEGGTLPAKAKNQTFVMAESIVFFESYRSVLSVLQRTSPAHFPMKDYILGRKSTAELPKYLSDDSKPITYDLSCVRIKHKGVKVDGILEGKWPIRVNDVDNVRLVQGDAKDALCQVPILDPDGRPDANTLGLDPSQTAALFAALTQQISVIQGPPGTGKTFLGLKIVKTLLKNRKFWNEEKSAPILVICFTNHALDQFLEGILKFTHQIIRIGGQSKSDELKSYSLLEWKRKRSRRARLLDIGNWKSYIENDLWELNRDRSLIREDLLVMDSKSLIHEDSLLEMEIIPTSMHCKIRILLKPLKRQYPKHWTPLGFWLQIYWNEAMENVLDFFNQKGLHIKQQAVQHSPVTAGKVKVEKETPDDPEWDKEHVDEIEASRKEDEEDLSTIINSRIDHVNEELLKNTSVKFALKLSEIEDEITSMKTFLEDVEGEDEEFLKEKIAELQAKLALVRQLLNKVPLADQKQLDTWYKRDLLEIPLPQRWMMYNSWKTNAVAIQEQRAAKIEEEYIGKAEQLKDVRTLESADLCQNADVVGMTTTGAAKHRALLNHIKPKIVIVEEAAEVLEAHVVCSLSTSCQQLILIGDHKQLRPTVTVHELAKNYFLDVSLFERLIKNGMEPVVLKVQHRMRPEVAQLIVPSIYPRLENHKSVLKYPNIRGMETNVFFLTHNEHEVADQEGKSHLNPYEADISLALARHLVMQGYHPKQITILTTYSGQLLHFWKIRRDYSIVQDVRISVVDNFQGEENDIIILSLVRSNEEENIGFLRIENRVCVALSRAKQGFYMIGNMQNLKSRSTLWNKINQVLNSSGHIGPDLCLKCDFHNVKIKIRKVTDFPPEGSCMEKCGTELTCGHKCQKICHLDDREHENTKCRENCSRSCSQGHPCPLKCFMMCCCMVMMTRVLPCSHEQLIPCFKDPLKHECQTMMWKILPICGHGMDLKCGVHPSKAVCPEICRKNLDCGHICPLKCHKEKFHSEISCEQPCLRACKENHPCQKRCHEDCGKCFNKIIKLLPCGHEQEIECHQNPQKAFCKVKVNKLLLNCEHTYEMECGQSTEGFKCEEKCQKLMCVDGHPCKKFCYETCGPCVVPMSREFECGHVAELECHIDPFSVKCRIPKKCKLPSCGHLVTIGCGEDPEAALCPLSCEMRLECGHACTLKCHVKTDPRHEKYECKKPCGRIKQGCKKEHICGKKCFEDCDPCHEKWKRILPCGHLVFTECHFNDEDIFCSQLVTNTIPECGHQIELACSTEPTRTLCNKMCATVLPCQHMCKKKCCEPCNQNDCEEPVTISIVNICGHNVTLTCKIKQEVGENPTEQQLELHLRNCLEPCGVLLDCQHRCKGTCGECFNGRVHQTCKEKCGRSFVCGHSCNISCGISCPPCRKKCEYMCVHSKCRHMCCEPCIPCQETCQWICEHKTCTKKCGQLCNRSRCDENCKKFLSCGHSCSGLCGEICPPLCRICDKDKLTEFILLGNEDDDDAKFVFLPDCGHCIEVEAMDHWMSFDEGGQIQPKCCPRCKTTIRLCMRYGDIIKNTFQDIAKAKKRILLMRSNPQEYFVKMKEQLSSCRDLVRRLESGVQADVVARERSSKFPIVKIIDQNLGAIQQLLEPKKKREKKVFPSLGNDQRIQTQVNLDVFERILEMMRKANQLKFSASIAKGQQNPKMEPELLDQLYNLLYKLLRLVIERDRISVGEYKSASRELDRIDYLRAYFVLKSSPCFTALGKSTSETQLIEYLLIKNVQVLKDNEEIDIKTALETVGKKIKTGLGISNKERQEINQAMEMGKGHWFKCPNGHIYAIGDCGGAMEEGTCNECYASIGGSRHRLLNDNRFAAEMDGADHPAWPPR